MKKIILILGGIVLFYGAYYYFRPLGPKIKIGQTIIPVEVAITEEQKELGLGNREKLDPNRGMLFPYDHKEQFNFWMKGMHFPLDFIWILGNTVTDITENVPPPVGNEQPVIVKPSQPVDKILEVNAGFIAAHAIKIGDSVKFIDR